MINKYISTENEIFKEYLNKRIIKNFDQKGLTLDTNAEGPDMTTTKGKRTKGIDAMAKRATKKRS